MNVKKWYLGKLKNSTEQVYLEDFKFDCGWYWAGGYIGNHKFHAHFDGAFLNVPDIRGHSLNSKDTYFTTPWERIPEYVKPESKKILRNGAAVWEDLSFFLDDAQYNTDQWWRIKDLFKQFYALKKAAEVFAHGGHCTSEGRNPKELNKAMNKKINAHIETVIIPEIRKALNKG